MIQSIKNILFITLILNCIYMQPVDYKISIFDKKQIKQAKTLEKIGKFEEAENIYENILSKSPFMKEAFIPLKNIYINSNRLNKKILQYADKYISSNNNDMSKQIDALDIYILSNHNQWELMLNNIIDIEAHNQKQAIKTLLYILLSNEKQKHAISAINKIRNKLNEKSYYALELGMHYSLIGEIERAMDEYLLYVQYNTKKLTTISDRIMLLSDYSIYIKKIKSKLQNSNLKESKIILADLEFKLKNYEQAYIVLQSIKEENRLIYFIDDLIKNNQVELAEIVIEDILTHSQNTEILDKAILQLAQLFESTINSGLTNIPISDEIYNNDLLNSPYIKLDESQSNLLNRAINIYDSLRIKSQNYISTYRLAEIKYRVQGDLDKSQQLYKYVLKNSKKIDYRNLSLIRIIDIEMSKGDLEKAQSLIENYKNSIKNTHLKELLDIKNIQLIFYTGNREILIPACQNILNTLKKNHIFYNDILDILSIAFITKDDNELKKYANIKLKLFQNHRAQVIDIIQDDNFNNKKIKNMLMYELAYLQYLQGNFNEALSAINKIDNDSIYKEYGSILIAEIYDYIFRENDIAMIKYNDFIDSYHNSIFYETIRIRLRELIKIEKGS